MGKREIQIADVGPRDGLQNVSIFVPTADKISLISALIAAGIKEIQIGSFVSPKAVPQFADIAEVAASILKTFPPAYFCALLANEHGANAALDSGIKNLVFVFSVSETHNMSNVRQSRDESIAAFEKIVALARARDAKANIRLDIATVFGCPFEGRMKMVEVLRCVEPAIKLGIGEVTLCDTAGMANPRLVEETLIACRHEFPTLRWRLHFHNTRGLALANTLKAFEMGITNFDAAIGGLGGCPFAPGASGNVATEEVVFMFNEMGIETGIDLAKLFLATRLLKKFLPDVKIDSAILAASDKG